MAKALGSLTRKNKEPQCVIQKKVNGGLIYFTGRDFVTGQEIWSEHPLEAKIFRFGMVRYPDGRCGDDYDVVQIS